MKRRTKIIASIGPACSDETTMKAMVEAGMDVARLNLSHGTLDESIERLHHLRRISEAVGRPVGVMADLPGPKVRIGRLEEPIELEGGAEVLLEPGDDPSCLKHFFVDYQGLLTDVHRGDKLSMGDGSIILEVVDHEPTALRARVLFGGVTQGRPGLHIPSDRLRLTTPTPEDLRLLDAMVDQGVDMIALSFVRSAHDVRRVGLEPAPRGPLVVAKIETRAAIENLDGIIAESGAIMVARGDLGTECSIQDLPHLQKDIIARCIALGRPAITATQMLESMISAPSPTRAEASDVANAVFDGTSAVMLSAETAIGQDPAHVVATMASIAQRADQEFDYDGWAHQLRRDQLREPQSEDSAVTDVMTMATWQAAKEIGAKAILCISRSGFTVRAIARFRPKALILAFSPEERAIQQLTMSWGAIPIQIDRIEDNVVTVHRVMELAKAQGHLRAGDIVAVLGGSSATVGATDTLRMVRCP
ncbi:MAG: pyruvate kinase [Actinomycetia bacterium]|nr:pyruvate kinase [Actinomycetes bacterium]MCP5031143.1 pyruvate kinase [Actinomycetes bacterium]